MNIDWSKAPEDATHAGTKVSKDVACWYRDNGDGQFDYWYATRGELDRDGWKPLKQAPSHWPLSARPVQSWNGEGIPPAGAVCEVKRVPHGTWGEAIVRFSSSNVIVWDWSDEPAVNGKCTAYAHEVECRPIRSTDQIAAEERDVKAKEMYLSIYFAEPVSRWESVAETTRETFRKAIDAGWQKVPRA